jgi:hypothetical protein
VLLSIAVFDGENAARKALTAGPPTDTVLKRQYFFHPIHANGPYAGERSSMTQCYELRPYAMIFARKVDARLIALIKALEKVARENADNDRETFAGHADLPRGPGACVIVLEKDRPKAEKDWLSRLNDIANAEKLKYVVLGVAGFDQDVEKNYELPREAEATVILAHRWRVSACWAFRTGELDDRVTEKIVSALNKLAAAKED